MKTAFVFPGQGSQSVGMGKDFYTTFASARLLIDQAEDILELPLKRLMFEGPQEDLTQTDIAQPALFVMSMAILQEIPFAPDFLAGHSLGEYTALCASGALSFETTLRLVRLRGSLMKEVPHNGGMVAVLGCSISTIEQALAKECVVANDNAPGQVIISGSQEGLEQTSAALSGQAKRLIPLSVSGAFHSPLMKEAQKAIKKDLDSLTFFPLRCPVISNVTAQPFDQSIGDLLYQQIVSPVRWRESVEYLETQGVERIIEIGSQNVLTGLNRRIAPRCTCYAINTVASLHEFLEKFEDKNSTNILPVM